MTHPTVFRKSNSEREMQILPLIAEGLSNDEIGAKLHITEDTVKTHLRHLFKRWAARNRAHCVHLGYQYGILTPPTPAAPGALPIITPPAAQQPADRVAPRQSGSKDVLFRRVGLVHKAVES